MAFREIVAPTVKELFIQQLEGMILSGELRPGDRLPTERELADEMKISKTVVHEGLRELHRLGFLDIASRRGVTVADYAQTGSLETLRAIMDFHGGLPDAKTAGSILQLRYYLEGPAMEELAARHTPADMAALQALQRQAEQAAQKGTDALAEALFDDERAMVRIDMSEYMEKYSVSRLIGAPPGYVGYEEGGQLTEAVRRKPYSVVLFDEVEKAHPDVFNILLQVLDDGRITDSQGRTVDFKNTVIILTSNLGSDIILNDLEQRRAQGSNELSEDAKHQIDLLLKSKFRPEFLNRLDEIVYYKSLTKDEMRKIVDLQLQDLRNRMEEGKHLKLEVTTAAKDFIIDSAYDSVYGARPIKRFIQSRVETLIAKAIIKGNYAEGNTLTVDYDGSALVLR